MSMRALALLRIPVGPIAVRHLALVPRRVRRRRRAADLRRPLRELVPGGVAGRRVGVLVVGMVAAVALPPA